MTQSGGCRLLHNFRKLFFYFSERQHLIQLMLQVLRRFSAGCRAPLGMNIKTGSDEKLARMRNDEIEKWKFKTLNVIWNMNCKKFLKVEQQSVILL